MPARPLHCKHCQGIFLPASGQPLSAVQCPHCSGQMQVGECTVADAAPAAKEQVWHNVTETEIAGAQREAGDRKWSGRLVFLACALPLAVLVAFGLMMAWRFFFPEEIDQQHKDRVTAMLEASAEAERLEIQKTAQQFLTAASWQGMLPAVADAERVQGVMAWYYQRHQHRPIGGAVEVKTVVPIDSPGRERRRVLTAAPDRPAIWLMMVQEAAVWKVDWEVFASANVERWQAFLREPAGTSVELPLLVALKPAAQAYLIRAGGSPDTSGALVLWAMERAALAGAVLEKDSPLWKELPEIGFENAVKVIARVTMADPKTDPPLVKLERIVQRGWLR